MCQCSGHYYGNVFPSGDKSLPEWFNPVECLAIEGGERSALEVTENEVIFRSPHAELHIQRGETRSCTRYYSIEWKVIHACGEEASGRSVFPEELVLAAFGLGDIELPPCARFLVEQYDSNIGAQGRFIRKGNFLNIPCPGTGKAGDPNLSLFITDRIQNCVKTFLQHEPEDVQSELC